MSLISSQLRRCQSIIPRLKPSFEDYLYKNNSLKVFTTERLPLSSQTVFVPNVQIRNYSSQGGPISRFFKRLGWTSLSNSKIRATGYALYGGVVENTDYDSFFEIFALPDTFYSWFLITELHVWMLSARLMAEGEDGQQLRNAMIEAMWKDVEQRSKQLGEVVASARREQVQELNTQFHAALFAYDEGIHGPDHVLAGALWRTLLSQKYQHAGQLETAVSYVRRQMHEMEDWSLEHFLTQRQEIKWTSLTPV